MPMSILADPSPPKMTVLKRVIAVAGWRHADMKPCRRAQSHGRRTLLTPPFWKAEGWSRVQRLWRSVWLTEHKRGHGDGNPPFLLHTRRFALEILNSGSEGTPPCSMAMAFELSAEMLAWSAGGLPHHLIPPFPAPAGGQVSFFGVE